MSEIDWAGIRTSELGMFAVTELPPQFELPALPHAVTLFAQKAGEPDANVRELSRIVETDSGLTLELLRYVNSAYVGLRQKVKSVQQALSLLGLRQSKTFMITTGMQAAVRARKSKLINQGCFWNASLQKALFARLVAQLLKADEDLAFAGALLQDYLLPVLTNDLFDDYIHFVQSRSEQPESLCDYERSRFGWDHCIAGACLAHRWQLPDELVCCILFHHHGLRILADPRLARTAAAAVALSALLPDQLRQNYRGLEQLVQLGTKWKSFNLESLVERVDALQLELDMGVPNDFPLSRRCRAALERSAETCAETAAVEP